MMPSKSRPLVRLSASPAAAIAEGGLLAHDFAGPSWNRWRAVLKAAYGEPMTDAERALFREVAERDPPAGRVRELWCIAGRRAGKDSIAAAIATTAALNDYSPYLRTGERASILCLAVDRNQAAIVHRYIAGYFASLPALRPLVEHETADTLELRNRVEITVTTNSFRAVRGRTIALAILDEVAYWRDDDSTSPDIEVFNAIEPGLLTIPTAMVIGISSPYQRRGLLFEKWRRYYGQGGGDVLVVRGPSRTFNPTLPQHVIDARLEADPDAGAAEYLAEWRSDLADFIDRALLDSAVDRGVVVRPPVPSIEYVAFADASGGRGSSFTLAVAHAEGEAVVLDAVYERRAPFDPADAVREVAELVRSYKVGAVTGDRYGGAWVSDAFACEGIGYMPSDRDRSALYRDTLPLLTAGRLRLLDHARLLHQFAGLERRTSRTGKDTIGPARDGADDLANAVAGAAVLAQAAHPSLIKREALLAEDRLVDGIPWCRCVLGVLALSTNRREAGIAFLAERAHYGYAAQDEVPDDPPPCTLVDAWQGSTVEAEAVLYQRLEELHRETNAYRPLALVPEDCVMAFHMSGRQCMTWPAAWLNEPETLLLPVRGYVERGEFKVSKRAAGPGLPLGAVFTLKPGEKLGDDPLQVAALIGLRFTLMWTGAARHPVPVPSARVVFG